MRAVHVCTKLQNKSIWFGKFIANNISEQMHFIRLFLPIFVGHLMVYSEFECIWFGILSLCACARVFVCTWRNPNGKQEKQNNKRTNGKEKKKNRSRDWMKRQELIMCTVKSTKNWIKTQWENADECIENSLWAMDDSVRTNGLL